MLEKLAEYASGSWSWLLWGVGALLSLHMTNLLTVRWKQSLFTHSKSTVLAGSAPFRRGGKPYVFSTPLARVAKRGVGTVNKWQRFLFRLLSRLKMDPTSDMKG